MGSNRKYLLSTRPLPNSIIEEGGKKNIIIEELSFIDTHPIYTDELIEKIKKIATEEHIVVFTSMNAVEAVAAHIKDVPGWKIYSIGNSTSKLIEENWGKDKLIAVTENGASLGERLIDDDVKEVIFFSGNIRRDEMPNKMRSEKRKVEEIVVYETVETASKLEKEYDGILFFSPSAVHSFYSQNQSGNKTVLFAIGKSTEEALRQHKGSKIVVAHEASKIGLAVKAIDYLTSIERR